MGDTSIEWTDKTWNPVRGCTRVSEGCRNCYAEGIAARFSGPGMAYEGLARMTKAGPRWTGKVRLVEEHLKDPYRWKQPARIFVNSMSDLFHESLPREAISRVFRVMEDFLTKHHTFQVLTKRPERLAEYTKNGIVTKNVWVGTSVEDQESADKRIPALLDVAVELGGVRFLSCEPLLGPIDLRPYLKRANHMDWPDWRRRELHWVIVGGESGHAARPCNLEWIRRIVQDCAAAGVPCFVKQLGAWPHQEVKPSGAPDDCGDLVPLKLKSRKGGVISEWPADLQVRQFPEVARG